jgi:fructokinase
MPSSVLCFGEILWDILPHGSFPGGAPFNVAYHLHRLGVPVLLVSAVGSDERGAQLLQRLDAWGIATSAITRHATAPTGRVTAKLGPSGDAHYTIATDVAWDHISVAGTALNAAGTAAALVFGSLALRAADNRRALKCLAAALPPTALRVFDVNLRAPYDDLALVREFAPLANVLKLNSAEAARLAADAPESPGREESDARALATQLGVPTVCVTAGERGAGLLRAGHWTWVPAQPVVVVDTIGAGDSFLAAFLAGLLNGRRTDRELVTAACRLGEWVAARSGATPDYDQTTPV